LVFVVDDLRAAGAARSAARMMRPPLPGSKAADSGTGERSSVRRKVRRPWQDRRMLNKHRSFVAVMTVSRRLAFGFRPFAKTMKDNRNVQYSSCTA
jgi:hypothetical protein